MEQTEEDFEKGEADGTQDVLEVIDAAATVWRSFIDYSSGFSGSCRNAGILSFCKERNPPLFDIDDYRASRISMNPNVRRMTTGLISVASSDRFNNFPFCFCGRMAIYFRSLDTFVTENIRDHS